MVVMSWGRGEEQKVHDDRLAETFPNLTLCTLQQLNSQVTLEMRTLAGAFSQFQAIKHTSSHLGDDAQNGCF